MKKTLFCNRLQEAMNKAGKSQMDLVNETGIEDNAINSYLSGECVPDLDTVYKLAEALNVLPLLLAGFDVSDKTAYIDKINILLEQCDDVELLDIIQRILEKRVTKKQSKG